MQRDGIGVKQELADDGVAKVAVGPLAEQRVPEFGLVPVKGQRVFVAPWPSARPAMVSQARACPIWSSPMLVRAMSSSSTGRVRSKVRVVGPESGRRRQAEEVFKARVHGDAHMFLTSSGGHRRWGAGRPCRLLDQTGRLSRPERTP